MRGFCLKKAVIRLTDAVAVLVLLSQKSDAQSKPFRISDAGVAVIGLPLSGLEPLPHWITGNAIHLGRDSGEGLVQADVGNVGFHGDGRITGKFGCGSSFVVHRSEWRHSVDSLGASKNIIHQWR